MGALNGLVPARFLTIIGQLILTIVIYWSRNDNVTACLPINYSQSEYDLRDMQILVGLSVTLGLLVLELIGFIAGISMFSPSQGLISTAAHCGGTVALAYFIMESWPCNTYWYIFGFCVCFPAICEMFMMIRVCACRL